MEKTDLDLEPAPALHPDQFTSVVRLLQIEPASARLITAIVFHASAQASLKKESTQAVSHTHHHPYGDPHTVRRRPSAYHAAQRFLPFWQLETGPSSSMPIRGDIIVASFRYAATFSVHGGVDTFSFVQTEERRNPLPQPQNRTLATRPRPHATPHSLRIQADPGSRIQDQV